MLPTRVLSAQPQIRCEATSPVTASRSQMGGPMIKLMRPKKVVRIIVRSATTLEEV